MYLREIQGLSGMHEALGLKEEREGGRKNNWSDKPWYLEVYTCPSDFWTGPLDFNGENGGKYKQSPRVLSQLCFPFCSFLPYLAPLGLHILWVRISAWLSQVEGTNWVLALLLKASSPAKTLSALQFALRPEGNEKCTLIIANKRIVFIALVLGLCKPEMTFLIAISLPLSHSFVKVILKCHPLWGNFLSLLPLNFVNFQLFCIFV